MAPRTRAGGAREGRIVGPQSRHRRIEISAVRFLADDVAVADGPYEIRGDRGVRRMWTTIVVVRQGGSWRIAAIRNAVVTG